MGVEICSEELAGKVVAGVDTHWLCVLDEERRVALSREFPADAAGIAALADAISVDGTVTADILAASSPDPVRYCSNCGQIMPCCIWLVERTCISANWQSMKSCMWPMILFRWLYSEYRRPMTGNEWCTGMIFTGIIRQV